MMTSKSSFEINWPLEGDKFTILKIRLRRFKIGCWIWWKSYKKYKESLFFQGPEITWRQLMCKLLGLPSDTIFYDNLLGRDHLFSCHTTVVRSYNEISVTSLFEHSVAYKSTRLTKILFSNSIFYFKFSVTAFRFGKHLVLIAFFDNFNFLDGWFSKIVSYFCWFIHSSILFFSISKLAFAGYTGSKKFEIDKRPVNL